MNKFEVGDKTFLIIGGLGIPGESLTEFVHSRGAKVWITDTVPESEGIEQIGSKYSERWGYSTLDVRNEDEVTGAFQKCVDKFGRPDIVFNMSQVFGEEDWRNVYDVNVKGAHICIKVGMEFMDRSHDEGKGGAIINISSFLGVSCFGDHFAATPAFTSSQHAVTALTRTFGSDLYFERTGVRVISIVPYYFESSKMVANGFEAMTSDPEALKRIQADAKDKKFVTAEEAALKIINVLNAKNGSVWFIRTNQLRPVNIPDTRMPKSQFG